MLVETLNVGRCAVHGAFAWWLGEIQGLVPDRLRRVWHGKRTPLVLTYRDGELRRQGTSGDPGTPGFAFANARRRRSQAILRLGPDQGLCTTLVLPLAAHNDLAQLLHFEMDRLTPFQADEVYFAYRISGTNHEQRRLAVVVHVAPSCLVDAAVKAAHSLGIEVKRVELAGAEDGSNHALNLLHAGPAKRRAVGRLNLLLGLLAAVLAVAAIVIPLREQHATVAALEQQVAATKVKAKKSFALRERLRAMAMRQNFVIERKIEAPMVSLLIAELTRLIPDQAYVTQLGIRDETIQVRGYAGVASELIEALTRSDLFHDPQFRSPVVRDPRNALEHFHISVQLGEKGE